MTHKAEGQLHVREMVSEILVSAILEDEIVAALGSEDEKSIADSVEVTGEVYAPYFMACGGALLDIGEDVTTVGIDNIVGEGGGFMDELNFLAFLKPHDYGRGKHGLERSVFGYEIYGGGKRTVGTLIVGRRDGKTAVDDFVIHNNGCL